MKYEFEEREISGGHFLYIHLQDVPTLKGSTAALECAVSDLISSDDSIRAMNEVLSGKRERIDSGNNMFWYTITQEVARFEYPFDREDWNFTISTKVLIEIAMIWNKRAKEFCKKYKYR